MNLSPTKCLGIFLTLLVPTLIFSACAGTEKSANKLRSHKMLAVSYARGGDFIGAIKEINAGGKRMEGDPEAHLIKGIAYFGLKDLRAAERSYKKALEIKSDYTKARYNLCGLYLKMNNPDDAIKHCKVAAHDLTYPLRYAALVNIAKAHMLKDDTASAELFFAKSIRLEPSNIYSRNEYGKLLSGLSRHSEAIKQFQAALRITPGYNEARLNLALALAKVGDRKSACSELKKTSDNKPHPEIATLAEQHAETICTVQQPAN
ncbi:tetratricopeptide repeat protein [Candidatus Mycalebacterium sp.]